MTTIPKPKYCDQDWLDMKPVPGGRLCRKCGHKLQDFTKSTWIEIEVIQQQNSNSVCGMYTGRQLKYWGREVPKVKPGLNFLVGSSLLLMPAFFIKNEAKAQTVQQQSAREESSVSVPDQEAVADTTNKVILRGKLIDKNTKDPVAFGAVILKHEGKQLGYGQTEINGDFSINAKISEEDLKNSILESPYVGYNTGVLKIADLPDLQNIELFLLPDLSVTGITSFTVTEPSLWRKTKWKVRSWFSKE